MPKIWVGRTTVNSEKKEDGLTLFCAWQNLLINCYNQYQNHRNHTFHWKDKCEKPNKSFLVSMDVMSLDTNIQQNKGILKLSAGLEIKKILRSPFGEQLEKYSRQMQIFSRQFESCKWRSSGPVSYTHLTLPTNREV